MNGGPLQPRRLAAEAVGRVLRGGAYSNVVLDSYEAREMTEDLARVKALTFGLLRRLEHVDAALADASSRDIDELDPDILDRMRISAYEILYAQTPTAVAVSAGVDLVKEIKPRAAGFANAVLRGVPGAKPGPPGLTLPRWLVDELSSRWSGETVSAFSLASASPPARIARMVVPDESASVVAGVPGAVRLPEGAIPDGAVIQDASSIAVGNAVAAEPGMSVLDIGAAPGGKTGHLLEQIAGSGAVIAMDRHGRRVATARRRVPGAKWLTADGRRPPFRTQSFDRVLLDAPCSGFGTLRRRPEIRLRVSDSDVDRLASLQSGLLEAALGLVAPGGRLVYSVCTVTPRETVDVVEPYEFKAVAGPGEVWGKGRLMAPHLTDTDGMFISVYDA